MRIAFLIAGVKILDSTQKPLYPAIMFGVVNAVLSFFLSFSLYDAGLTGGVTFILALAYFWALHKITDRTLLWWFVLLAGFFLGFV